MSIYKEYCEEIFDESGKLKDLRVKYDPDFNFGYDVVDRYGKEEPDKTALVWCCPDGEERIFTFKEIMELSNKALNVFKSYGIKKGDKVMTVLKRRYEYWYVSVALHKLGALIVPVTHMLTEEDLAYRIKSANIKAAISVTDREVCDKLKTVKNMCSELEVMFSVKKTDDCFVDFEKEVDNASPVCDREEVYAADAMAIYFTSGTTGQPKGVIHDNTYPLAHIVTAKYWQGAEENGLHFTVAETGWAKTSWGKIYGQWLVGSAVMVFDFDNFDPRQIETIINRYSVTTFCAPPTIYRYMVMKNITDLKGLKKAVTAGEALSKDVFHKFKKLTGMDLIEGYGQTETTLLLANFDDRIDKTGSMGKPSPMYDVKAVKEDGSFAVAGEVGEIVVIPKEGKKQTGVFCAYHENPQMYEYVWRDGIYHTGDSARIDEDGYFWFEGRIDDVIKTGGYRVGPFEIENVLSLHPAVVECSVVGVPDPSRGQAIKAVAVLDPAYEASKELQKEIKEFCNTRLAEYKWVRIVEFVKELPKTISGKTIKSKIRHE
ncbi:MAG: acetyl-CoA synthetase [Clostridiales bacterium]|nr:acetyl-CoA synthetase [Clostridiales bacterium]